MARRVGLVLAILLMFLVGCGGEEPMATLEEAGDGYDSLTAEQSAKLSPDLLPLVAEQGNVDVIVQVDPQVVFVETIDRNSYANMLLDPAVIWKARQDGAVIWKLTPEQAVIWKMSTDKAVIWKVAEQLSADGFPVEEAFENIHAVKINLSLDAIVELAKKEEIAYITPDRDIEVSAVNLTNQTIGVTFENTRQTNVNFTGLTGEGIGVAVIDSGIKQYHGDFNGVSANRVVAKRNFTNEGNYLNINDNYGHGTTVAGLIAGNGKNSYDSGYNTTFEGVAPEANLIVAKVLKTDGTGTISSVISALQWVQSIKTTYNIRVVNLSLGLPAVDPWYNDPLCAAVEAASANGLAVVVAAGNYGWYNNTKLYGSIASPGISPSAITVGAGNTRETLKRMQDQNGLNDFVAIFSSRGPVPWTGGAKPDLVAPGVNVINAYSWDSTLGAMYPDRVVNPCDYGATNCSSVSPRYFKMSGTSAAAPIVAGTAVLMLQAQPLLNPNTTKAILMLTAQPLLQDGVPTSCYTNKDWRNDPTCIGLNAIEQGSGLLNVPGAVDLSYEVNMAIGGLLPGDPWVEDPDIQPETYFNNTGETLIWSQGLAWTGGIVYGKDMWTVWQEPYQPGVIWGTGLAWTGGVVVGDDPVWSPVVVPIWKSAFINPFSIAGDNNVLGGFQYDWEGDPDFSGESDDWFPEQ